MSKINVPPVRVLEAQYIKGSQQIMHRVQLSLGDGQDPLITWMPIEEWRCWKQFPHDRAIQMARMRLQMYQMIGYEPKTT